jgi:hypothetical protein
MNAATPAPRQLGAGLMVYLTRAQRQQLREVLKEEGVYSASAWLRQLVVQKLRAAEVRQEE